MKTGPICNNFDFRYGTAVKYNRILSVFIVFFLIVLVPLASVIWVSSQISTPLPKEVTEQSELLITKNICEIAFLDIKFDAPEKYHQLRGKWLPLSELLAIRKSVVADGYFELEYSGYLEGVEACLDPEKHAVDVRIVTNRNNK